MVSSDTRRICGPVGWFVPDASLEPRFSSARTACAAACAWREPCFPSARTACAAPCAWRKPCFIARAASRAIRRRRRLLRRPNTPIDRTAPRWATSAAAAGRITHTGQNDALTSSGCWARCRSWSGEPIVNVHTATHRPQTAAEMKRWIPNPATPILCPSMPSAVACFTFDHLRAEAPYREIDAVLDRHGVRSTFFIEGRDAERDPDAVADIVARGHEVGCHGWAHEQWSELSPEREREMATRARDALRDAGA